jgi:transcriptional regulator GlxA family with amidase domain
VQYEQVQAVDDGPGASSGGSTQPGQLSCCHAHQPHPGHPPRLGRGRHRYPVRHLPEVADLADVWDSTAARQVAAALAARDSAAARRAVLTNAVASRLASSGGPDPRVLAAVSVLGNPRANVGAAARYAGLSSRQLRRLFDEHIGLPPKILHSIPRFQRLRAWLAASGPGPGALARAAADCGYFDQAHLCRDCARLGGLTPATLLAASASPAQINVHQ